MSYMTFVRWLEAEHAHIYRDYYPKYQEFVLTVKRQRNRDYQRKLHKDAKRGRKTEQLQSTV